MRHGLPGDGTEGPSSTSSDTRSATFAEKQTPTGPDASPPTSLPPGSPEYSTALASQWRWFGRVATVVAILTAPVFFLVLYRVAATRLSVAIVVTVVAVVTFRGLVEWATRRFIPYPRLFGEHGDRLRSEDVTARRRAWFWQTRWLLTLWLAAGYGVLVCLIRLVMWIRADGSWRDAATLIPGFVADNPEVLGQFVLLALTIPGFFLVNIIVLFGPMMWFGIRQINVFEPGEADWGVKLDDVRGQDQPKEAIRRVVSLWQSGEEFEQSGGKQERGVLFLGAPGTGKTMVAKSVASGFNAPFISAPGTAFAGSFMGVDIALVQYLAWRARRVARKWGNKCIVFIDEIDSVGLRRENLASATAPSAASIHDVCFFGAHGALTSTGDLVLETKEWRDRLFAHRAPCPSAIYPQAIQRLADRLRGFVFPGLAGQSSSTALRALLVLMDGVSQPKPMKRYLRTRINNWLDALFIIPTRIGRLPLRLGPSPPRPEQLYFIGACNVPIDVLDPALTRPGRMGRHIFFRTPTKNDRRDVFDLYLDRVAHDEDLDRPERREELARISLGFSPAGIAQICGLALTNAHHDGRSELDWDDLVEALTVLDAGVDSGLTYQPDEADRTAIHEAGHAMTGHLMMRGHESSRLSITPRSNTLGHHMMVELDEHYGRWRHEKFANLVWTLGAMAAELSFFDETTTGVSGDIDSATATAALMVGAWGMPPQPEPRFPDTPAPPQRDDINARQLSRRFEQLGLKLVNRTSASPFSVDPVAAVLSDMTKRALVAQLLGQAFYVAHNIVRMNRAGVRRIADQLIEKRELFGDDVVRLIEGTMPQLPELAPDDEATWPSL